MYAIGACCLLWGTHPARAQTIDPYQRLVDPLALARIDNPDFGPLRLSWGLGYAYGPDTANPGYYIYAEDTGAGIITHLFVTDWAADSTTDFKLFIDGTLVCTETMQNFFDSTDGFLRNPLDTIICLARLCDVQIPYQHGFKLSFKTPQYTTWYDYAWRPLPSDADLPSGEDIHSPVLLQEESQAEAIYRDPSLLWQGTSGTDSNFSATINPGTDTTVLTLAGSNIVRDFRLVPSNYDTTLDSVWLEIYWDGAAAPAISTPLVALFGQSFDFRDLHSVPIDFTKDSGFEMRLPMPFAHSMQVEIQNRSSKPISIRGKTSFFPSAIDRSQFGYLHAQFNSVNPTRYGVPHHVMHVKGRGKYVGLLMGIPDLHYVQAYEGDPMFHVDSNDWYSYDYDGTEDYFNGAQYFACGNFMMPFGGTSNSQANYYRFHYLDALDFRTSFDFDFQHGTDNDAHEYYRTLPFWYQQSIRYWTDRDTIRPGELWNIAGAAYSPGEAITVMLDSIKLDEFNASSSGTFSRAIAIDPPLGGFYHLQINGESYPEGILITNEPTIQLLNEPHPINLQTGDTLLLGGEGYVPGDSMIVSIGDVPAVSGYTIDDSHHIHGWAVMPECPDGDYHVSVAGRASGGSLSPETLHLTRTLKFECEDLWDSSSSLDGTSKYRSLIDLYSYSWSHDAVLDFIPDPNVRQVQLHFFISSPDTFSAATYLTRGTSFGNYDILLDGTVHGHFDGYSTDAHDPPDSIGLGVLYLDRGTHTISYRYTGTDPLATDSELWADYLRLVPTTSIPALASPIPGEPGTPQLFPDPASDLISVRVPELDSKTADASILNVVGTILQEDSLTRNTGGLYQFSVAMLPSGTYWLRLRSGNAAVTVPFHVLH
jgi:hypothetical protein